MVVLEVVYLNVECFFLARYFVDKLLLRVFYFSRNNTKTSITNTYLFATIRNEDWDIDGTDKYLIFF